MTVASTIPCESQQPAAIDRVALRVGLALVAWARRAANRPTPTREQLQLRYEADRVARELFEQRHVARGVPGIR